METTDSSILELEDTPSIRVDSLLSSRSSQSITGVTTPPGQTCMIDDEEKILCSLDIPNADQSGIPSLIAVYKPVIIQCVDALELISALKPILGQDKANQIRIASKNDGRKAGIEKLLDCLEDVKNIPGKWRCFVDAVKEADYEYVAEIISEESSVSQAVYTDQVKLVELFEKNIVANIRPRDVVPELTAANIISDPDREQIEAEERNLGPTHGMMMLMHKVWRKHRNWYSELLKVIYQNKPDLAKEIDPDLCAENKKKGTESVQCGNHEEVDKKCANSPKQTKAEVKTYSSSMADEESNNDDDDDCDTEDVQPIKTLDLYCYQKELTRSAMQGKNCIVVSPTGSGKTHIAMKSIQHHIAIMKDTRIPKVVFLVDKNALAAQQFTQLKEYVGGKIKHITGETQRVDGIKMFSKYLDGSTILVVTAQILLNAINSDDDAHRVNITQFSLIVFDECHHTTEQHPYNQIMFHYMQAKFEDKMENKRLPQIIGLTASVGTGQASTDDKAVQHVKTLMANMDAQDICTVRDKSNELAMKEQINESNITIEVRSIMPREEPRFGRVIERLMIYIEDYMLKHTCVTELKKFGENITPPASKGSEIYTQWVSEFSRSVHQIQDKEAGMFYHTCQLYLEMYNKALLIYHDARPTDAMNMMTKEISKWNQSYRGSEVDVLLSSKFDEQKLVLEHLMKDSKEKNPKLEEMRRIVERNFVKDPNSLCIVFAKTRDLVSAIESYMNETEGLKDKRPVRFVGTQASVDKGGITRNNQNEILAKFRNGKHRIVIATSIAEEGLDIPKCNLVIRYDYVTNEIAMMQSRGRGRAENSAYIVITTEGSPIDRKERVNVQREEMMKIAIAKVQKELEQDSETFYKNQEDVQIKAKKVRDMQAKTETDWEVEGRFVLRCSKCREFLCLSSDIRVIENMHHACISQNINSKIVITKSKKPGFESEVTKNGIGKMKCKSCHQEIGVISSYMGVQFPIISIKLIRIDDQYGNTMAPCKQWKHAPFSKRALKQNDLDNVGKRDKLIEDY